MTMREFEIRTDPVQINAPIDVVWTVLTEVEQYSGNVAEGLKVYAESIYAGTR